MIMQNLNEDQDFQQLIKIRRTLHQIPQIGLEEHQTSKFVRNYLSQIPNIQILPQSPLINTAVIARINVQNSDQTFLFRCELDALAWEQKSGLSYASKNGIHHACGHDAHMSILLVACKKIAKQKQKLKRSIVFCFQPGQQGKGGAKKLIQNYSQLLNSVTYAFAIHGGNHFSFGYAIASSGIVSANSQRFQIVVKGKGCHVMIPQSGIDANYIGCNLVTQLYSLKQTKLSPSQRGTLCITKVEGGTGIASISEIFKIQGSLRMISVKSQQKMRYEIQSLVNNFCKTFGADSQIHFISSYYRSVENHQKPTNIVLKVLKYIFAQQKIKDQVVSFNGQDFCQFSQRVPSCYFILGAGIQGSFNQNNESQYPLHSNKHQLDERFMLLGLKVWIDLAFSIN